MYKVCKSTKGVFIRLLVIAICIIMHGNAWAATLSPVEVLRQADRARGNLEGVIWKVEIESKDKHGVNTMNYEVSSRGFDLFADSLAPPKYKGYKLLMLNGNMWFYKPGLSKPVPISQRQKLNGNAAYGDIASTNYADDYDATILADEAVDGEDCYLFDLKAKDRQATYDRIKYWISKGRGVGVKAEYFTVSGKLFKSARMDYENTVVVNGHDQPFISRIVIVDELMSKDKTTLRLTDPKFEKLPDYIFNLNLLRR